MSRPTFSRATPLVVAVAAGLVLGACRSVPPATETAEEAPMAADERDTQAPPAPTEDPEEARWSVERAQMVDQHLARRYGLDDQRVLDAMRAVPRHRFVPRGMRLHAYDDRPLPIGEDQTISQPYIVARMTQLSRAAPGTKALDVGTGSGYQAAVLAELTDHVYSIEILCTLADRARGVLGELGYENITVRCGDGYRGWPEQAPFDVIIVAAAPKAIPQPLIDQLAPGGRLVIPVGPQHAPQTLTVVERMADGRIRRFDDGLVRFVPMTGEAQQE